MMLKEPRQARPLLIRSLIKSLAAISMLAGCARSDKTSIADPPVSAHSRQQAAAFAASETDAGKPGEPMPRELPSTQTNWEETPDPTDPRDHSGDYWGLRNAFPLPDLQEITISEELGHMLEEFFGENPEISEEVLASTLWLTPGVF